MGTKSKPARGGTHFKEFGTIIIILLIFIVSAIVRPDVFASDRLSEVINSILLWVPLILTVALGMMMIICSKNIDLSVGSTVGLTAVVAGVLFRDMQIPIWLGFVVAVGLGAILGMINGLLIAYLGIPAIIVTLGTMNAYRGLAFIVSDGKQISSYQIPSGLLHLVSDGVSIGGFLIPWIVWIVIALTVIVAAVLKYSHFGREIYAIGSNTSAAHLRGINVKKNVLLVFVITGALAGLAGMMYTCRYGYVNPSNTGNGYEFIIISATIIGGTSINGGNGTVLGTVLGTILLGSINTMLSMVGVSGFFQLASYGLIILIALNIDKAVQLSQMKNARKERWN